MDTIENVKNERIQHWLEKRERIPVSITLPWTVLEQIDEIAQTEDRSRSGVITEYCRLCLQVERKKREQARSQKTE